jgi:hypothetical protein
MIKLATIIIGLLSLCSSVRLDHGYFRNHA